MLNKGQEWKWIEDKRIRKLLPTNYLNSFTVVQPFVCMCASGAAQLTRIEQHWIVVCRIISYILPEQMIMMIKVKLVLHFHKQVLAIVDSGGR